VLPIAKQTDCGEKVADRPDEGTAMRSLASRFLFQLRKLDSVASGSWSKGLNMNDPADRARKQFARHLRKNMTIPERLLWGRLRGRRLAGHKFLRQAPIDRFVVDFLCRESSLVIELDGESHNDRCAGDIQRQHQIEGLGYRVLRISNDEVLRELETVVDSIVHVIEQIRSGRFSQ
jgi:very-short-patch-repair endonuclease